MASSADEAADSRTSALGRKRRLWETSQDHDVISVDGSSQEESSSSSSKRVKQAHQIVEDGLFERGSGLTSIVPLDAEQPSRNPAEAPAPPQMDKPTTPAVMPLITWNQAVRGGLRTSFATKPQSNLHQPTSLSPISVEDDKHFQSLSNHQSTDVEPQQVLNMHGFHAPSQKLSGSKNTLPANNESTGLVLQSTPECDTTHNPPGPLKKLSTAAQRRKQKMANLQAATAEAEVVLQHAQMPLPENFKQIAHQIASGNTFYPRKLESQEARKYRNRKGEFVIPDVFDGEGKPIKIQNFTFSIFVPAFLKANRSKWERMTQKDLVGAFSAYVSAFYGHVMEYHAQVRASTEAPDAPSVAAAIRNIKLMVEDNHTGKPKDTQPKDYEKVDESSEVGDKNMKPETDVEGVKINHPREGRPMQFIGHEPQLPKFHSATSHDHGREDTTPMDAMKLEKPESLPAESELRTSSAFQDRAKFRADSQYDPNNHLQFSEISEQKLRDSLEDGFKIVSVTDLEVESGDSIFANKVAQTRSAEAPMDESLSALENSHTNGDGDVTIGDDSRSILQDPMSMNGHKSAPVDASTMEIDISDVVELALQQRYFPRTNGDPIMGRCLACAQTGHNTYDCPSLSCTLCGDSENHSTFMCPQNQRCGKCRQRGHQMVDCREKLLPTKAEMSGCDICNSRDHLEASCHFLWRSFAPRPEEIRVVSNIPVHCYTCGASGHYGPECGLHNSRILSGGVTWSKSNLQKYIDPTSKDRPLSAGIDYSMPARTMRDFGGKASEHITIDDSEDNDSSSFIRRKISNFPPKPRPSQSGQRSRAEYASLDDISNHRASNPPRRARPNFAIDRDFAREDSARHGRERTFSPPPRYGFEPTYNSQPEESRFRRQLPERRFDRPTLDGRSARKPTPTVANNSRGVQSAIRGRRGGGGNKSMRGGYRRG